jgi:hypothetical protein
MHLANERSSELGNQNAELGDSRGFSLEPIPVDIAQQQENTEPPTSAFSQQPAIAFAFLQRLGQGEGELLYHPAKVPLAIGDVLYLRERGFVESDGSVEENGVVVQVIGIGTANYQAAEQKSLFRLMTAVRADQLQRSFHEPPETLDEFMEAKVRVRASIRKSNWEKVTGQAVTRNVDIFAIDPSVLLGQITRRIDGLSLDLGTYKSESVVVFGGGFEKVNLITGMKGAGKSHIAKGIID